MSTLREVNIRIAQNDECLGCEDLANWAEKCQNRGKLRSVRMRSRDKTGKSLRNPTAPKAERNWYHPVPVKVMKHGRRIVRPSTGEVIA